MYLPFQLFQHVSFLKILPFFVLSILTTYEILGHKKSFENITLIRKKLPESSSLLKIGFNSSSSSRFCLLISSTVAFSLCESNQSFFSSQNLFPLNCQEKRTQDFTKTCLAKPLLSLQTRQILLPFIYLKLIKVTPFGKSLPIQTIIESTPLSGIRQPADRTPSVGQGKLRVFSGTCQSSRYITCYPPGVKQIGKTK